jgi:hypothetical protein
MQGQLVTMTFARFDDVEHGEDDAHCELIRRGAGPVGNVKSACDKVSSRVDLVQA